MIAVENQKDVVLPVKVPAGQTVNVLAMRAITKNARIWATISYSWPMKLGKRS